MSARLDDLVGQLFDRLAEASPAKVQRDLLMSDLGITDVNEFHQVKGMLQDVLGGHDALTVVGEATGDEGGWYYGLESNPADAVAQSYLIYKTRQGIARLRRHRNVMQALARSSGSGAAARMLRHHIKMTDRMIEDLVEVLNELVA